MTRDCLARLLLGGLSWEQNKIAVTAAVRGVSDPLGMAMIDLTVHVTAALTMVAFADDTALGKQPFNLQGLPADLPLQFGLLCVIPAPLSEARKGVARPLAELAPTAVQDVGVNFKGPCDLGVLAGCLKNRDKSRGFLVTKLPQFGTGSSEGPMVLD